MSRARVTVLAITALAPISWGTTYAVTTSWLPPDRPLFNGMMRALPAGAVLCLAHRRRPTGVWRWRAPLLGALYIGAFFPLLFIAAERLPGGVAALLGSVGPLLTVALARVFVGEAITGRRLAAGVAGVVGVALVVLSASARLDAVGVVAGLTATGSMVTANVLVRRWGRPEGLSPLGFVGWELFGGGLMLLPLAFLVDGVPHLSASNLGGFAYLGAFNTSLAYALWFRGIARLPVNSIAFLALCSPVTATIVGWLVLDQRLSLLQWTGVAVSLGATAVGALAPRSDEDALRDGGVAAEVAVDDLGDPDVPTDRQDRVRLLP